jgi:hypothetical protein
MEIDLVSFINVYSGLANKTRSTGEKEKHAYYGNGIEMHSSQELSGFTIANKEVPELRRSGKQR